MGIAALHPFPNRPLALPLVGGFCKGRPQCTYENLLRPQEELLDRCGQVLLQSQHLPQRPLAWAGPHCCFQSKLAHKCAGRPWLAQILAAAFLAHGYYIAVLSTVVHFPCCFLLLTDTSEQKWEGSEGGATGQAQHASSPQCPASNTQHSRQLAQHRHAGQETRDGPRHQSKAAAEQSAPGPRQTYLHRPGRGPAPTHRAPTQIRIQISIRDLLGHAPVTGTS